MAEMPETIYAIGDVHGCLPQLLELEDLISADASTKQGRSVVAYLGDYVDRGPDSAGVIDHLIQAQKSGIERVTLLGNHEAWFLEFLDRPDRRARWLIYGGRETLQSYGIDTDEAPNRHQLELQIAAKIPEEHRGFLQSLPISLEYPGYFFTHAGIDPDRPLARQLERDLLSIRAGFLDAPGPFEKCIVFGHTPRSEVEILPDRISVDTGAYATGILSAVRLSKHENPKVFRTGHGT